MVAVSAEGTGGAYRGDEAVASARPGRDGNVFKDVQH
jgi:hypothetical protein